MTVPQGAEEVPTGSWYPENIRTIAKNINTLCATHQAEGAIAVFDLDNTCIFRDIGQAVFRYQANQFYYRLTPKQFAGLLPQQEILLDNRPLQQVTDEIIGRYAELINHPEKSRSHPEYLSGKNQFAALFQWFVQQARKNDQLGPKYILPLLCQLFAGFSITELKDLANEAITNITQEPLDPGRTTAELGKPIGSVAASYELGIRPFEEMQSLMRWLTRKGIRCQVISASTNWLVEAAVERFDYPVALDDIYGIRCTLTSDDILTTDLPKNYPVTYRQGKADVIQQFMKQIPCLVAGDADTDYEMLTLPGIPLRLIINRNQQGAIQSLYDHPDYLLQGISMGTGQFLPSRQTPQ